MHETEINNYLAVIKVVGVGGGGTNAVNHPGLFLARVELVEIFMVGTKVPKGVPRPVVKSTM